MRKARSREQNMRRVPCRKKVVTLPFLTLLPHKQWNCSEWSHFIRETLRKVEEFIERTLHQKPRLDGIYFLKRLRVGWFFCLKSPPLTFAGVAPEPSRGKAQVSRRVVACAVAPALLHLTSSYLSFKTYPGGHLFWDVSPNCCTASCPLSSSVAVVLERADLIPPGTCGHV